MTRVLAELVRGDSLDDDLLQSGSVIERTAVRGVICRDRDVLLLFSAINGDYKFPGGGVEPAETQFAALRREISEECGARVAALGAVFGDIIEYAPAQEDDVDVFRMVSRYVVCAVADGFGEKRLDDYERDLELRPVWVDIDKAIATNEAVLRAGTAIPRWLGRETLALRLVRAELIDNQPN